MFGYKVIRRNGRTKYFGSASRAAAYAAKFKGAGVYQNIGKGRYERIAV